ncbi:MAG: hypothetical protein JO061_13290 [Acidobacteriaceae bacterium]|nr:hypothetical protein [Acidobacteriaceae bacterium]
MNNSVRSVSISGVVLLSILSSAAMAQTEVPQAQSSAGPAVAALGGTTYIAWAGIQPQPENLGYHVAYTTLGGTPTVFSSTFTRVAPALAAARGTVYLAIRGNAPLSSADFIYYSSLSGTELTPPTTLLPGAQTKAAPALTGDSSTLFAAWTAANGAIQYATYAHSWSAPQTTPFTANPLTGPSLALFNGNLYVAWVGSSNQLNFASLALSTGVWSPAHPVGAASNVAPALGVYNLPFSASSGLYIAFTSGEINLWKYDTVAGTWSPGPISPRPLVTGFTPALLSANPECPPGLAGSLYSFDVFYTSGPEGNIYFDGLLSSGRCHIIPCSPKPCQ